MTSCPSIPRLVLLDETDNFVLRPCGNCPWRRDAQPGEFDAARFRDLASTAYDMAHKVFTCHKSTVGNPLACAGFLLRGADNNLTVRANYRHAQEQVDDAGLALYDNYREMAIANGVDPDDPVLVPCRD